MTKKTPRVPETRNTKPNREQRRHPDGRPQDHPLVRDTDAPPEMNVPDVPPQRNKKTADKWNQ